ncbi:DUF2269 family protein [Collimonas silvisoli]|uniref:DUF2269 family protein n=1 Tax=Collimonas silvisoli TaxID=2825884 RepID=UPI001B8C5710|nr:DUF2269 domain-containing protein [Collimonas silvisoli]
MNIYLMLKWTHIMSSVLLVGTGFGSAFYLYFIHRTRNPGAIAEVVRLVVRADFWFTTPAIFIQPLTGYAMLSLSGYPITQNWVLWTFFLYALAGACWLPVVWLQIQMSKIASASARNNVQLPAHYWQYARYWEWLGYPAFIAMLVIYGLMVFKPS